MYCVLLISLLISCRNIETPSYLEILIAGSLTDSKYSNSYFGLDVTLPKDWIILNKKQIQERKQMGLDLFFKSIDTTDLDVNKEPRFLININKYPRDAQEALQGNGGFQISFLKKSYFPDHSGDSFLGKERQIVLGSKNFENISELQSVSIGGKYFYTFSSELHLRGFIVQQRSFILEIRNCFLLIDISYRGDFIKPEIDGILKSITFSN